METIVRRPRCVEHVHQTTPIYSFYKILLSSSRQRYLKLLIELKFIDGNHNIPNLPNQYLRVMYFRFICSIKAW